MSLKVVTWGTGNVGKYAIRAVLNHPELELVGHIVSSDAKAGVDAATLAELDTPCGVAASTDIDAVLDLNPDCVVYTAHSETRMMEAAKDQARCLRRGINVLFQDVDLVWFRDPMQYFHDYRKETFNR